MPAIEQSRIAPNRSRPLSWRVRAGALVMAAVTASGLAGCGDKNKYHFPTGTQLFPEAGLIKSPCDSLAEPLDLTNPPTKTWTGEEFAQATYSDTPHGAGNDCVSEGTERSASGATLVYLRLKDAASG